MRHLAFVVVLSASLSCGSAYANETNTKPVSTDPDQAIKCRKVEVSGSLIKKGKVCRTVAEWKRIIDNGNRTARAVVQEGAKPTN